MTGLKTSTAILLATLVLSAPAGAQTPPANVYSWTTTAPGGTLYNVATCSAGGSAGCNSVSQSFVPTAASPLRYMPLTGAKSDAGVALTATPGSGAFGVSRTAGTSLVLTGETTSASAVTDQAIFELVLADTYVAGANIPIVVNCNYGGSGTVTAASTTMTVAAYLESATGAETALTVSAAQRIPATAGSLTFTLTGTTLPARGRIVVELTALVTSASGANTGQINSVALQE